MALRLQFCTAMEPNEMIREKHRPDWLSVFAGTLMTFAFLGVISMIGVPLGLLTFKMSDSIPWIVTKLFIDIVLLVSALFAGGYIAGATMSGKSRVAAAMNGFLVWEMAAIAFGVVGWFGYAPIPGVYFTHGDETHAGPGILWMSLSFLLPVAIPAAYGAIAGNDQSGGDELEEEFEARAMYRREEERLHERQRAA